MVHNMEFLIPGKAIGKGRPRFARRGAHMVAYSPEKTVSYELLVRLAASEAMGDGQPIKGACTCNIDIRIVPPASWSKKRQEAALAGELYPMVKPDLDNVAKAILDACNGIVWADDKQVVELRITKRYAHRDSVLVQVDVL